MQIRLTKVHGSENDFFILDQTTLTKPLTKKELDQLREKICDRTTGLLNGADGLLLIEPSKQAEVVAKMRVLNQDGSEASMCGNGLRTVARYLAEKEQQTDFLVETMHANLKVRKASDLAPEVATFQVEISPVSFQAQAIPMHVHHRQTLINHKIPELSSELSFSVVAVPNPHLVTFVTREQMESGEQERIAKLVNQENPWFPDGINVSFVEVLSDIRIFVRTYERGVGFTNACGTAMCASSLLHVLLHNGEFYEKIDVINPGGMVQTVVHQDPEGNYWMELIGNATFTHQINGELDQLLAGDFDQLIIEETGEQKAYQQFVSDIKMGIS